MYLKINYDDSKPIFEDIELGNGVVDFFSGCYSILDCDHIEVVPTVVCGLFMIIDEEGKLRSDSSLRYNTVATMLYGSNSDFVTGDSILCRVKDEEIVPLTDVDIKRVKRCFGWY